ncbi:MAG: hypothetical protein HY791_25580 [Deltaproteobacteria bacterium]|nr:hypothetical protein [Deltaproteobacteria bacterium]
MRGWLLLLHVAGCSGPTVAVGSVPDGQVVAAVLSGSGGSLQLSWFIDGPIQVDLNEEPAVFLTLSAEQLGGFGDHTLELGRLSARLDDFPAPNGSCGRCGLRSSDVPVRFGPGLECPFPRFGSAYVLSKEKPQLVEVAMSSVEHLRSRVRVDYEGPCAYDAYDPQWSGDYAARRVFPVDPAPQFATFEVMPNGTAALFGADTVFGVRPDGSTIERSVRLGSVGHATNVENVGFFVSSRSDGELRYDFFDAELNHVEPDISLGDIVLSDSWVGPLESVSATIAAGWGLVRAPHFLLVGSEPGAPGVFSCTVQPTSCERVTPRGLLSEREAVLSVAPMARGIVTVDLTGRALFGTREGGHWRFDQLDLAVDFPSVPSAGSLGDTVALCVGTTDTQRQLAFFAGEWTGPGLPTLERFFDFPYHGHCHSFFNSPTKPRQLWMGFDSAYVAQLDVQRRAGSAPLAEDAYFELFGVRQARPAGVSDGFEFAKAPGDHWLRRASGSAWQTIYDQPEIDGSNVGAVLSDSVGFETITERAILRVGRTTESSSVSLSGLLEAIDSGSQRLLWREGPNQIILVELLEESGRTTAIGQFLAGVGAGYLHAARFDSGGVLSTVGWRLFVFDETSHGVEPLEIEWDDPVTLAAEREPEAFGFRSISAAGSVAWAVGTESGHPHVVRVIRGSSGHLIATQMHLDDFATSRDNVELWAVQAFEDGSALLGGTGDGNTRLWRLFPDEDRYSFEVIPLPWIAKPDGFRFVGRGGRVAMILNYGDSARVVWSASTRAVELSHPVTRAAMDASLRILVAGPGPRLDLLDPE